MTPNCLHILCNIILNNSNYSSHGAVYMGAGTPAKTKKGSLSEWIFFRAKVRLMPYLAKPVNNIFKKARTKQWD